MKAKTDVELEAEVVETDEPEFKGAFFDSLNRNNRSIKKDRAIQITEAAQMHYKREIEDMELQLKQLRRERIGMLDLSPSDKLSLVLASDFDSKAFVNKDISIGVNMRNLQITLDIAKASYKQLFG